MKKSMTKTDMNKVNGGTPHYHDWGGKLTSLRRSNRRPVSVHNDHIDVAWSAPADDYGMSSFYNAGGAATY